MTDILDLPDWTLLAKHHDGDEYELEAEYRLLPGGCVKCGSVDGKSTPTSDWRGNVKYRCE